MALAAVLACAFLATGCDRDDDREDDRAIVADQLTSEGWAAFEMADLDSARGKFEDALAVAGDFAEAHNGLGWARLRLGSLGPAVGSFEAALDHGLLSADPHAGQAVAYLDREPVDLAAAAAAANRALLLDGHYRFAHDPAFDWRDLRLILAQSYFGLQRYAEASAQVDSLGGTAPDPDSERFIEELLLEIERLGTDG